MKIFLLIINLIGLFCFICCLFDNLRITINSKINKDLDLEDYLFIGWVLIFIVFIFELILV